MSRLGSIACVTGGSGMVGKRIVEVLLGLGFQVRVLSRKFASSDSRIVIFEGDLLDEQTLSQFFSGAEFVFHCAAELHDHSSMWDVNVKGTKKVLELCNKEKIKYFCYLSSAGVVGKTQELLVTESTDCHPQDAYERSKWAAEKLVRAGIKDSNVVILRPTNVIDENRPGALLLGKDKGLKNRLKVFLKGGECAHLVHAEDVARAAIHFMESHFDRPECFFVSCDDEQNNTFSGIWALYQSMTSSVAPLQTKQPIHLSIYIPYLIRRLFRGTGNLGNVRYSSSKLMEHEFSFKYGLKEMVDNMILKYGK